MGLGTLPEHPRSAWKADESNVGYFNGFGLPAKHGAVFAVPIYRQRAHRKIGYLADVHGFSGALFGAANAGKGNPHGPVSRPARVDVAVWLAACCNVPLFRDLSPTENGGSVRAAD